MAGPWEKYGGGQTAQPQVQRPPARIYGAPQTMTPAQVASDQRAQESAARQQESLNLQKQREAREQQKFQTEQQAGDLGKATGEERKGAGYLGRAIEAFRQYEQIEQGAPGYFSELARGIAPDLANMYVVDASRQQEIAAQDAFISAVLRQDSGAAIPPEERERERRVYFPVPGDLPATIEQKRQLRRQAIGGLRLAAGRLMDETVARFQDPSQPATDPAAPDQQQRDNDPAFPGARNDTRGGLPIGTNIQFNMDAPENTQGFRFSNDQLSQLQAFMAENPNATPQELNAFAIGAFKQSLGDPQQVQEAMDYFRRTGQMPGIDYSQTDAARKAQLDAELQRRGQDGGAGVSDMFVSGYTGSLADEVAGLVGGVGGFVTGGIPGAVQGYQQERDLQRRYQEVGRENLGPAAEIAGAVTSPIGAFTRPTNSVRIAANRGALGGTVFGFGSGDGLAGSVGNALLGGAGGYVAGAGLQAAGNALAPRIANVVNNRATNRVDEYATGIPVVEAGQRQGIPIRQPDARPTMRDDLAALEASPNTSQAIQSQLQRDREAVQARLQDVGGQGTPRDQFTTGEALQGAGQRYIAKSRAQANALYNRAEQMAGNVSIRPAKAIDAIDQNIADLKASGEQTNAGTIRYLEALKSDLSQGNGLSIQALRNLRTNMRGQISERNLTATDAERRVMQVLDAASEDISAALPANAKAAYDTADRFFREKQTFIKDVAQRFLGTRNAPLSPEQAASRFEAMTKNKGDYQRFRSMMKQLEPQERADIAATMAEGLGKGKNGEFSLAALSTNIDKMSPRAIRELFGDEGARAIADLKIIARAKADTAGRFNSSSTARVANRQGLKDILLGAFGYSAGGVGGAVAGMATRSIVSRISEARAAKLLMNPDFTKWLKNAPQTAKPEAINAYFNRLETIGARTPALASDIQALQQALREAFSASPGRLAASEDEGNRRPEPPQQ